MNTIREYLAANDGQSLLGSLLQYGFDPQAIDSEEANGNIEIKDSLVYLVEKPGALKVFRIGEYALGGIVEVSIVGKVIVILAKDWHTGALVKSETISTDVTHLRAHLDDFLNDITSSYYAEVVLKWIEQYVEVPSYW